MARKSVRVKKAHPHAAVANEFETLTGQEATAQQQGVSATTGLLGDWQLAAGHYVPAKMTMQIVAPRPNAELTVNSRYKWAYPGLLYQVPIAVQGGAYPFYYEITATGGTSPTIGNATIGSFLTFNPATGTWERNADYGVISWTPSAGEDGEAFSITVRVTDQDGTEVTETITGAVSASKFIFFDQNNAGSANLGTIAEPYNSWVTAFGTSAVVNNNGGKFVYLRGGTHDLTGFSDSSNNLRLSNNYKPAVWMGYPGESATLVITSGHFIIAGQADVWFSHLEVSGNTVAGYQFRINAVADRHNWFMVGFTGYTTATTGDVPAHIYNGSGTRHSNIINCECYGAVGNFVGAYSWWDSVWEGSVLRDRISETDSSQTGHSWMYFKDGGSGTAGSGAAENADCKVSIRANTVEDVMTTAGIDRAIGVGSQGDTKNLEICWNRVNGPLFTYESGSWDVENIYTYRNSIAGWSGVNPFSRVNDIREKNVSKGAEQVAATNADNIINASAFDATMHLTGSARTNYLGTHGAEIA